MTTTLSIALLASAVTLRLVQYTMDLGIVIVFAGMILCVIRLLRGPHLADRALAADTLATHLMALLILFTMRAGTLLLFDGVVVLALLGFLTTVAFAQHILRPHARRMQADRSAADKAPPGATEQEADA